MLLAILCGIALGQTVDAERERKFKVPEIVGAAQLVPGSRVADVGAGDGFITARLARAVGKTGRVWAVDIDKITAIPALKKMVKKQKLKQVEVVTAEDGLPSLPTAGLDAVVMVISYHEVGPHEAMLRAIHAALRMGGRLVMVDFLPCRTKDRPRAVQARAHALSPGYAETELRAAGFEIAVRDEHFLEDPDGEMVRWLIVARK